MILSLNWLILVSLDSLFHQLFVEQNFQISSSFDPLNLTFDQLLFIFKPNVGADLRDQLLLKYKLKFDNFSLFGILWLLAFYSYVNCKIWISFG